MTIPSDGFVVHIIRDRNEQRGSGSTKRYRTVGHYQCYMKGVAVSAPDMSGASVEPRGPGNNQKKGKNLGLRIEQGTYRLGTHGFAGAKYGTFNYHKNKKPRPGLYVHDTDLRTAILIHVGRGFKSTVGCINLTGSIVGPHDDIGPNTSFGRLDALIKYMAQTIPGFPGTGGVLIDKAWLVIEGEP